MPEESQSILYIGYVILLFLGLMLLLSFFLSGLTSIEANIEQTHQKEYRKAIVLENLLSLDADTESLYGYSYTHRRSVIPVEFFTNYNPDSGEIGYRVQGRATRGHCYIPRVEGLDGQHFAFGIDPLVNEALNATGDPMGQPNVDFKSVVQNSTSGAYRACTMMHPVIRQRAVVSTAMLVREDKNHSMLPVRLYVYDPYPTR
ncbi:hypothetical protein GKQ38_05230 [Candidatus Nanohaloarchaea archaeon]|nr:hypothetical protein GKQ38_05230 [Candidatus Nanohaloarchaea archaeon]